MKIVTFWGGLGNQIFEYAYYQWLKNRYPMENIYAYHPKAGLMAHNGLELFKCFDVIEPPCNKVITIIATVLFYLNKILNRLGLPSLFTCTMQNKLYNSIFHCDWWQDKMYYAENYNLDFTNLKMNLKNQQLLKIINDTNSVSIHIRRGDYIKSNIADIYGGICTEKYYDRALSIVDKSISDNKQYIFFSDDPDYVREHYSIPNIIIVDWNNGEDSFMDMYLMSKCKYMILANSTFSYWSAMFNKTKRMVICPSKWNNLNFPDITLSEWIQIEM